MDFIRVVADTQVAKTTIFIKAVLLDHTAATSAVFYDEADSSKTAAATRLSVHVTVSKLTELLVFPNRGLRFTNGCYINWMAGQLFYAVG